MNTAKLAADFLAEFLTNVFRAGYTFSTEADDELSAKDAAQILTEKPGVKVMIYHDGKPHCSFKYEPEHGVHYQCGTQQQHFTLQALADCEPNLWQLFMG